MGLNEYVQAYKSALSKGDIPKAYQGLIRFMMDLRAHFTNAYPEGFICGSVYLGYMDITYFPFTPQQLKKDKLKIGVVLNHRKMRFEVWLVGQNKQIQKKYWEMLQGSTVNELKRSTTPQDSIFEYILVAEPNFDDLEKLTKEIESGTMRFIDNVVGALNQK